MLSNEQLGQLSTYFDIISPADLKAGYAIPGEENIFYEKILEILINVKDTGAFSSEDIVSEFRQLLSKVDDNPYEDETSEQLHKMIQVFHDGLPLQNDIKYNHKISDIIQSKSEPKVKLAAILSNTPRISLNVRHVNDILLFMNSIPTIEINKCQPFLDVQFQIPRSPLSNDGRLQTPSTIKFLIGAEQVQGPNKLMAEAFKSKRKIFENGKTIDEIYSSTYMDIFTAPQSLMNLDFQENSALRNTNVIDPTRPFMSLDSFDMDAAPTVGLFSFKTAKLNFTLHDRSRLSEISDFIKPEVYVKNRVIITYGWSSPNDDSTNNPYGAFLNKMRMTETYGIKNSSFSFDNIGQVKLILELFTLGANDIYALQIADSEKFRNVSKQIQDIVDVVSELRDKLGLRELPGGKEVRVYQILDGAEKGPLPKIEGEDLKELNKLISRLRQEKSNSQSSLLADKLEQLFIKKKEDSLQQQLANTFTNKIQDKINKLTTENDPFLMENDDLLVDSNYKKYVDTFNKKSDVPATPSLSIKAKETSGTTKKKNINRLVSLGKLLLIFAGEAFQSVDTANEIQFIFYPFNDKAGISANRNIAEFPIEISYFKDVFTTYAQQKNNANLPVGEFIKLVNDAIIQDIMSVGYGFRDLYKEPAKDGKPAVVKPGLSEKAFEDRQAQITSNQGGLFKMPVLEFYMETLPKKNPAANSGIFGQNKNILNESIIRIHIFDKQSSPHSAIQQLLRADLGMQDIIRNVKSVSPGYESILINALSNVKLDGLENTGLGSNGKLFSIDNGNIIVHGRTDEIKKFVSRIVPTIKYGTNASAIYNANLQSLQDQLLSTVQMIRAGKPNSVQPNGIGAGAVPLRIIPASLDLTCLGCPLLNINQQFFIDFSTGTSVDNIYLIVGLSHTIKQGVFESRIKLSPLDAYGTYSSVIDKVDQLKEILKKLNTIKD